MPLEVFPSPPSGVHLCGPAHAPCPYVPSKSAPLQLLLCRGFAETAEQRLAVPRNCCLQVIEEILLKMRWDVVGMYRAQESFIPRANSAREDVDLWVVLGGIVGPYTSDVRK